MAVRFVLDCDTGSDDAIAIFAATAHPGLDPIAITTVNGNVALEHTTDNTLRALRHVGVELPVYAGADRPLVRPDLPIPRAVLNKDTDFQKERLEFSGPAAAPGAGTVEAGAAAAAAAAAGTDAVSFLVDTYRDPANADVTLVATGPLTNIALALAAEPGLADRIPRLVLMGGAHANGNVTASAEFNLWADPEAAQAVFEAGIRDVVVVPLDATHSAPLSDGDCDRLEAIGTPAAIASAGLIRHRLRHDQAAADVPADRAGDRAADRADDGHGGVSSPVHDPMCVAYLLRPDIITEGVRAHVSVETEGSRTLGELIVDTRPWCPEPPNATVALRASVEVYREFLSSAFREQHPR